jgi:hypothetical protein
MKGWFLSGEKYCPILIEPDQWAKLCQYYSKPKIEEKAQIMANAQKQIKRHSNVGWVGKARQEAQLVFFCFAMLQNFAHVIEVCGEPRLPKW